MKINNNRGFSLIEVLVTVGLVGLLVGIAIPSYNGYKQNTVKMALKADLGNGAKTYNAKYAVDSSFCHEFSAVGLSKDRDGNPIYKKSAFYGFETIGGDCGSVTLANVQYKTVDAGTCSVTTHTTKTACQTAGEMWTSDSGAEYTNSPAACELDANAFWMGATTNVSNLLTFITVDEEGKVKESTLTARDTGNCIDPG